MFAEQRVAIALGTPVSNKTDHIDRTLYRGTAFQGDPASKRLSQKEPDHLS